MKKNLCDVATLASSIEAKEELINQNIVKVITNENIEKSGFSEAVDFKREVSGSESKFIYHHVGIYGFTKEALISYVNLKRSKLELERNLEQMRALDNNMTIGVGYVKNVPISVDTREDLMHVESLIKKKYE